jgi:hypothetical protein
MPFAFEPSRHTSVRQASSIIRDVRVWAIDLPRQPAVRDRCYDLRRRRVLPLVACLVTLPSNAFARRSVLAVDPTTLVV